MSNDSESKPESPATPPLPPVNGSAARTEMKCRICGCFSSAVTCWHCATNPAGQRVTQLEQAMRDLLTSADCSWYERNGGHDWRVAVDAAERLLRLPPNAAMSGAVKDKQ